MSPDGVVFIRSASTVDRVTDEQVTSAVQAAADTQQLPDSVATSGVVIYECILPAVASSVSRMRHELTTALERYGVAASRCEEIALVFSEAATNAVLHAYPDASSGPLYVAGTLDRDAVTVSVCDCGGGLKLGVKRAGLGAGLALMMRLVDHLEISSDAKVKGTCLHATFDRAAAVAAPHGDAAGDRRDMLQEYLRVLNAAHAGLADDSQAVLAEARQAIAHSRRSRQERLRRR
jgi:anti-sigma regulatory factor (Ser/Thr protein kinase)